MDAPCDSVRRVAGGAGWGKRFGVRGMGSDVDGPEHQLANARLSHLCLLATRGTIRERVNFRPLGESAGPCERTASAERHRWCDQGRAAPGARSMKEQAAGMTLQVQTIWRQA